MSEPSNSENDPKTCPTCGGALPDEETNGLCPVCLMASAMEPTAPEKGSSFVPPSVDEVQAAFPKLEIIEIIAVGGMGVVYKAKQTSLNREVALKLLAPRHDVDEGFAERFTREAQALAAMNHPNIVTVHDFGRADDFFYLLMEFVDGVNLRQAMKAGGFSPEEALVIVPAICDALQYAHDQGIVHRDIKPENLLLDRVGRVKVADFGIARILKMAEPETATGSKEVEINLTGEVALGTPSYMAPEQADAPGSVDHRADIYSLGVVFYEMLTGERPSPSSLQPPSSRVGVDVRVDEVVLRALADSPELRWQSATDLRTQVQTLADVSKPPPPLDPEPTAQQTAVKPKRRDPWKWVTFVCGLISIPFVILGLIALYGVLDDGSWNPNPAEGFLVWTLWLGAIGFVIGTIASFVLSLRGLSRKERIRRISLITGILMAMVSMGLPVAVFIVGANRNAARAAHTHQRIRAEQAQIQSLNQQAFTIRVELTSVENKVSSSATPEAKERLKAIAEAMREELEVIEKHQTESQATIVEQTNASNQTPMFSVLQVLAVGVVTLLLFVGGLILIGKSKGGVAIGCLVCLIVLFALMIGLFLMFWGYQRGRAPASDVVVKETQAASKAFNRVSLQTHRPAVTSGPQNTAIFSFELETEGLPDDWTVWAKTRYISGNDNSKGSRAVGGGGRVEIVLRNVSLDADVMAGLNDRFTKRLMTSYLSPGGTVRVLNLTDANGKEVKVDLELRPKGGEGRPTIYLQKCQTELEHGNISIGWVDIEYFDGYDLVLETRGTSVFTEGESIDETSNIDYSRRIVNGEQKLTFVFPKVHNYKFKEAGFPKPWTAMSLDRDTEGVLLFGFNNPRTGLRTSARLKLVPKDSLEEVPASE